MELGTIFTEEQYDEAYEYISANGYTIEEIEPKDDVRKFKIVAIPAPTEAELKQARIAELQAYLDSTDWYVTRYSEVEVPIPAEVTKAREEARKEISTLRGGI